MAEYGVTRHYLDWIINLPWGKTTEDKLDLKAAKKILDEQHFGLAKVKNRLLEFLAVIKLKKQIKGPILCLVGPPGVGKTSLGKSVADALGRKFARISLGGMRDEAEIRGHRRTYVGALPGRILHALRRAESNNPVILLDEIDKVGSDFRGDPSSALLEVLDPAQNNTFTDHYLDLPFDLSRVLFITTANWMDPIHPALRDRLEVIELPGYTESEKLQIAKRYLVPRQLDENGLNDHIFKIPEPALRRVIQDYTREAGVRQLEREIAALMRKAALKIVSRNGGEAKALTLTPETVKEYLGPQRNFPETAESITENGIATGLAWTPVGGEILFIEATRMPGKGGLILTGSLGDVMKESAQTALSYLRSQSKKLKIDLADHAKFDIHIHVPAGATPKDGPSAGVTIVVALASLLLKRRVRSDMAMTGEISLRGRVLRVGGIKEKSAGGGAFRGEARAFARPEPHGLGRSAGRSAEKNDGPFCEAHFGIDSVGVAQKMSRGFLFKPAFLLLSAILMGGAVLRAQEEDPYPTGPEAGRKLAEQLRSIRPEESTNGHAVLKIFGRGRKIPPIPLASQITVGEKSWMLTYVTSPAGTNLAEKFSVIFSTNGPNKYFYARADEPGKPPGDAKQISNAEADIPVGGSDFWLSDLGLEFLHWPDQVRLKGEMRDTRPCYVLVSINPHPAPGGYSRVKTWIEKESGQPLIADAYGAEKTNTVMKSFSLGSVDSDKDGRYHVKDMKISHGKSWTRMEIEEEGDKKKN